MVIITIQDHTNQCYTNHDGEMIYDQIVTQFERGQKVKVSFKGIDSVSSSFVNSAFINLLEKYGFDKIKSDLGFIDSSKAINEAIKRRFSFEVNERKKLVSV
ncbi:STAS-like domain-containing protein [Paenibacillus illinoisensis]|uniref:STAS-like domain-containing protein n=1 Tax=Paenibacillus illinoisensis TaxID=59845 RepID=A0ABW8HYG7_9BACL